MRNFATRLAVATALLMSAAASARADVPVSGTFIATEACPAYRSFRKSTNPGEVRVEAGKVYALIAKNKPDATHYRIDVESAEPRERWVALSCGRVEAADLPTPADPQAPRRRTDPDDGTGTPATHVLAMSWQPAFCATHAQKTECKALTPGSAAATRLSLHGLWPQPRSKSYCDVAPGVRQADRNRDWDALPEPEISETTRKRLADVMPGLQSNLHRHEWIVHGTCYGGNAESYFAKSAELAEATNATRIPQLFADNAGRSLSADAIRAAFDEAFGAGAGARVAVSCDGRGANRKIVELTLGLAGDVTGTAPLGDLMRAARPAPAGCPGGLIETVP